MPDRRTLFRHSKAKKISTDRTPKLEYFSTISTRALKAFLSSGDSLMAEQFRKLRSCLKVQRLGNLLNSVLITSLVPGEGKTTLAANLSATIVKSLDDTAIMIDADLRKRGLTTLLGLQKAQGLADVLSARLDLDKCVIKTGIQNLSVLPAGQYLANASDLIPSTRMKQLLEKLRDSHNYSYIIIDSPPLIATAESQDLIQMVDGVIFVILAEKTRRDVVKRELALIDRKKILGIVLNGAEFEVSHHYKKYYKDYYPNKS